LNFKERSGYRSRNIVQKYVQFGQDPPRDYCEQNCAQYEPENPLVNSSLLENRPDPLPIFLQRDKAWIGTSDDERFLLAHPELVHAASEYRLNYPALRDPALMSLYRRALDAVHNGQQVHDALSLLNELADSAPGYWPAELWVCSLSKTREEWASYSFAQFRYVVDGIKAQINGQIPSDELPETIDAPTTLQLEQQLLAALVNFGGYILETKGDASLAFILLSEAEALTQDTTDRQAVVLLKAAAEYAQGRHADSYNSFRFAKWLADPTFPRLVSALKAKSPEIMEIVRFLGESD
jgi:hypothetical protein